MPIWGLMWKRANNIEMQGKAPAEISWCGWMEGGVDKKVLWPGVWRWIQVHFSSSYYGTGLGYSWTKQLRGLSHVRKLLWFTEGCTGHFSHRQGCEDSGSWWPVWPVQLNTIGTIPDNSNATFRGAERPHLRKRFSWFSLQNSSRLSS